MLWVVLAQQEWVTRAGCDRAGCQHFFYFSESRPQPCVSGTAAFAQFFLMISQEAFADLILHQPDPFMQA